MVRTCSRDYFYLEDYSSEQGAGRILVSSFTAQTIICCINYYNFFLNTDTEKSQIFSYIEGQIKIARRKENVMESRSEGYISTDTAMFTRDRGGRR